MESRETNDGRNREVPGSVYIYYISSGSIEWEYPQTKQKRRKNSKMARQLTVSIKLEPGVDEAGNREGTDWVRPVFLCVHTTTTTESQV